MQVFHLENAHHTYTSVRRFLLQFAPKLYHVYQSSQPVSVPIFSLSQSVVQKQSVKHGLPVDAPKLLAGLKSARFSRLLAPTLFMNFVSHDF